jgi:hypothetical protein
VRPSELRSLFQAVFSTNCSRRTKAKQPKILLSLGPVPPSQLIGIAELTCRRQPLGVYAAKFDFGPATSRTLG